LFGVRPIACPSRNRAFKLQPVEQKPQIVLVI